jgi:hypothetical protein
MIIHNAAITGSLTLNGIDISDITGSEAGVGALNAFSSSILSYTASNDARLTALNAQTASILSYTSSNDAKIAAIYTATSSLNASVSALNAQSASLLSYTSSTDAKIASIYATTSSQNTRLGALEAATASLYTTTASLSASVAGLNLQSASLLSYTSSTDSKISSIYNATSSLQGATSSLQGATSSLQAFSSSILSYTSSNDARVSALNSFSSSILSYTSSTDAKIASIYSTTSSLNASVASLNSYTQSTDAKISAVYGATSSLQSATSSLNAFSGSILSYTSSTDAKIASIYTTTSSLNASVSSLNTYTSSLNAKTASFATTGSNTFTGRQYISDASQASSFTSTASFYTDGGARITKDMYVSGTAYFNNITVFGTQSVSYISSSQLNIGTNLITVNTDTPTIRFGGLAVYDSGSTGLTGSILWDSQNNHWVYSNPSGSSYSGGMFISGPRSSALGSEQGTTLNALMKGQGGDHMTSSAVFDVSGSVGIGTSSPGFTLDVNGNTRILGGSTYLGQANVASGHLNAYELMTFNIDVDNDDSNRYFAWYTNAADGAGSELMRLNEAGNVGIGTTDPTATLHLRAASPYIYFDDTSTSGTLSRFKIIAGDVGTTQTSTFGFDNTSGTANKDVLSINEGGNVGIGTNAPDAPLNIYGTTEKAYLNVNALAGFAGIGSGSGAMIYFNNRGDGNNIIIRTENSSRNDAAPLAVWTENNSRFIILNNGNVGVGTTSPDEKLRVSGKIKADAIYVYDGLTTGQTGVGASSSGGDLRLYSNGSIGAVITTGGQVIMGATNSNLTRNASVVGTTGFSVQYDNNSGTYLDIIPNIADSTVDIKASKLTGAFPPMTFHTSGSERMRLTDTGRLILKSTTPGGGTQAEFYIIENGGFVIDSSEGATPRYIEFTTGGTTKMLIKADGNIGIGTTTPSALFHIHASGGPSLWLTAGGSGTSGLRILKGDSGTAFINNQDNVGMQFQISGSTIMTIDPTSFVGIGTVSPQNVLHVHGSSDGFGYMRITDSVTGATSTDGVRIGYNSGTLRFQNYENSDIQFLTNTTTEAIRIKSDGNVGIGTTSPTSKLHILYPGDDNAGFRLQGDGTDNTLEFRTNNNIAHIQAYTGSAFTTGASLALNAAGGNVGIGTTSPTQRLDVVGKIRATDDLILAQANPVIEFDNGSTGALRFYSLSGSIERMRVQSNGNVGIGTSSPSVTLQVDASGGGLIRATRTSAGSGYIQMEADGTNGSLTANNILYFNAGGSTKMTILSGGNVGIGNISPSTTLDISGSARITNASGSGNFLSIKSTTGNYGGQVDFYENSILSHAVGSTGANNTFFIKDEYNNAIRILIGNTGNVGIGTTSPGTKLDVWGTIRTTITSGFYTDFTYTGTTYNFGVGETSDNVDFKIAGGAGSGWISGGNFRFFTQVGGNSPSERMRITPGGNVGIGSTSPSATLDVSGSSVDFVIPATSALATAIPFTINSVGTARSMTGNAGGYSFGDNTMLSLIAGDDAQTQLALWRASDAATGTSAGSRLAGFGSRGSMASPVTVGDDDVIFSVEGWAIHGAGPNKAKFGAGMRFVKDDDFGTASTYAPQRTEFYNANSTTTLQTNMTILPNGNVGIGTTSPTQKLEIVGGEIKAGRVDSSNEGGQVSFGRASDNATAWYIDAYGSTSSPELRFVDVSNSAVRMTITGSNVGINSTAPGYTLDVNGTARFGAVIVGSLGTGTVYSNGGTLTNTNPSDRNLKENIAPLTYGLSNILQLNPVSYNWKDGTNGKQFGFIAQEVQEVMPDAVKEGEYLGLEKDAIYSALVNAIKELKAEIDILKQK